jgi:hypothetical protein
MKRQRVEKAEGETRKGLTGVVDGSHTTSIPSLRDCDSLDNNDTILATP